MLFYKEKLIENIGKNRYQHSIRVLEVARVLAEKYNVDIKKAEKAAFFHDCAKYLDKSKLLKKSEEFGIINDILFRENLELLHGPLGAKIAEKEYGINDKEILDAIKYHTTGRLGMTDLEKIIYLADYIEPMRNFLGVENVRELVDIDLDKSMIKAMDQTIVFLIKKGSLISKNTIDCRNELIIASK